MGEEKSNDVRSRDDSHLHKLVSETREWMKAEGIGERALDWTAVAREEESLWWRERLDQALSDLAARSGDFAESVARRLQRLAGAAQSQAEAALEVAFDAVEVVGRVLLEPASACLRADGTLEFTYAPAALRNNLGLAEGDDKSVGIFITSNIPGARVIADAHQRKLTVEFWEPIVSPLVLVVPEDPALAVRVAEVVRMDEAAKAVFDLQPGRYLLSIYIPGEDEP